MATIKRRGKTWQLNWSDAGGQHRVSLGKITERDARIRCREKELELLTGRRYGQSGVTLEQFATDYLTWYASQWPSTYKRTEGIIRQQLLPNFGQFDLDQIKAPDVTRWIVARRAFAKPATITKEARALQAMLNKAVAWQVIDRHSLAGFSAPPERASKAPTYFTQGELAALYLGSPNHANIWRLMANTGLRRNEALNLRGADVLPGRLMVRSEEASPTKSRRWREVPLNTTAQAALDALLAASTTGDVLPRVAPTSLSRAFVHCAIRAGLTGSLHVLRHTFISHLVMAGVDLPTVRKIVGHASITTTMRYAHLSPDHALAAVEKIAL